MRYIGTLLAVTGALCLASTASAIETLQPNDALICQDDPVKLDPARYLRALSLDLRGQPPSMAEIESLDGMDIDAPLPDALIDGWLDDDLFVDSLFFVARRAVNECDPSPVEHRPILSGQLHLGRV